MTEAPPPPLLPPSIRTRFKRIALALVALLFAWVAMAIIMPRPAPPRDDNRLPPPAWAPPPPMPVLSAAPPPPPPPAVPAAAQAHLQALEDRIARLEIVPLPSDTAASAGEQRLAQLEARVEEQRAQLLAIEQRLEKNAAALTALTLFHQMKEAVLRGDAYRDSWNRLNAHSEGNLDKQTPLTALGWYADSGVATLEALKAEFEAAVPVALASDTPTTVSSALQSLIRVRKVGEGQKGSDDEAIIARAEAKLARGEVSQSFKELGALSPKAFEKFSTWKEHVEAYVVARHSLDMLEAALQDTPSAP